VSKRADRGKQYDRVVGVDPAYPNVAVFGAQPYATVPCAPSPSPEARIRRCGYEPAEGIARRLV